MARKILQVIETAYRATLEEQDDTIVWITHAMKGAGADLHVLLRGNAVNYAVKGQDASGLSFGEKRQTQPPRLADDVAKLIEKGVEVFVVENDVSERGLERGDLISGLKPVSRAGLPKLFASYDQIWHW
jgi:sulfur relay (sulfurtransferase) DsrF/TusC family protein